MNFFSYLWRRIAIPATILLFQHQSFAQPIAAFSANPVSGCAPVVVQFTDQSTGNPSQWRWELGNGTISFLQHPSTTYFNPGTYTVKLVVRNVNGADSIIKNQLITVYPNPVAGFTSSDSAGCIPLPVQFIDQSSTAGGTITTWSWDFGDGTLSSVANPSHTYTAAGNFTVTLKVTNSFGCVKTFSRPQYIKIKNAITADFTNNNPSGCAAPVTIQFTNASAGDNALTYTWDFGDGTFSTATDPVHTFTSNGSYTVSLIAVGSSGCRDTIIKNNLITVGGIQSQFTGPGIVCQNQSFNLVNTSVPLPPQSLWDFGDGSTSTQMNPTKAYASPGTYTIKLVNQFTGCADSISRSITVNPQPVPGFSADQTISCKTPFTVSFTNLTPGNNTYTWNFGDGSTSTATHPVHIYNTEGSFTVTLTAVNEFGCSNTIAKPAYIRIERPVITLNNLPRTGCIPLTITPTATVTANQPVATYLWDFGDGSTSTLQAPTHTYTAAGNYPVSLIIETTGGCRDTIVLPNAVRAGNKPDASFSVNPSDVCAFQPVQFTDNSTGVVDQWLWLFGDGTTSTVQNPTHPYQDTGYFSVTLIVWSNTCADTIRINNVVHIRPPIARFIISRDCNNKYQVNFTDQSIGPTGWLWDFGDGTTSVQQHNTHDYATTGSYQITLTVTNGTCSHTATQTIRIIDEKAVFAGDTVACKGSQANFNGVNINAANIAQWQWDFGDGTGATTASTASHIYTLAGSYTVTLVITDLLGCKDSSNRLIRVYGPSAAFTVSQPSLCLSNDPVLFTDASTTDGTHGLVKWRWNYGDGTIDSLSPPPYTHIYTGTGTYTVSLTVTDSYGCSNTATQPAAVIISKPIVAFHSPDTNTCINKPIQFINSSAGNGLQYSWNFGDGQSSTDANPVHSYTATGQYTVSLLATDQYGCRDSLIKPLYINISLPSAAFNVSDSFSTCPPLLVKFTNQSVNYISLHWEFGDGNTSTLNDPSHFYNLPGVYFPKLVVAGPGGCLDSTVRRIEVQGPSGTFSYTPLKGCKPLTVLFTATTTGSNRITWDFSDGTTVTGTDSVISHTYLSAGEFMPRIILHDSSGCNVPVTGKDTIKVIDVDVRFGSDQSVFCDSATVHFHDSTISNDLITGWQWNFGDGSYSNNQHPSHAFTSSGTFQVSLLVTSEAGCTDSLVLPQTIALPQPITIQVSPADTICVGESVQVSASGAYGYTWTPATGLSNSSVASPRASPVISTLYTVIGNDSLHCYADTAAVFIKVYPIPVVEAGPDRTIIVGDTAQLHATGSADISLWNWTPSFNLSCASCPAPVASPKQTIQYKLEVRNDGGCRSTDQLTIVVICNNGNVFIPNTFSPNGDGMNDRFYPRGKGLFSIRSLRIFSRWGELVFERFGFNPNDAAAGWDGTYKGKPASPDVYVYVCDILCENGEIISHKGDITLLQ